MTLYWQFEVGFAKVAKCPIGTGLAPDWPIGTGLENWRIFVETKNWPPDWHRIGTGLARIGTDWHGLARVGLEWIDTGISK